MKNYLVEYYTRDGRRVGIQINAWTALDARYYAEKMPDFRNIADYPKEVR